MSLKIVHINRELKEDPVKELAKVLVAKWKRRDKLKAAKQYAKLKHS